MKKKLTITKFWLVFVKALIMCFLESTFSDSYTSNLQVARRLLKKKLPSSIEVQIQNLHAQNRYKNQLNKFQNAKRNI